MSYHDVEQEGRITEIYIAPESGAEMTGIDSVEAVADRGLRGDRYFKGIGSRPRPGDITLIEGEALDALETEYDIHLDPGEHRRNVVVRDVAMNHLVDSRFRVGEAVCEGMRLCEPCKDLERWTDEPMVHALFHWGGLRAKVIETGQIETGDPIVEVVAAKAEQEA